MMQRLSYSLLWGIMGLWFSLGCGCQGSPSQRPDGWTVTSKGPDVGPVDVIDAVDADIRPKNKDASRDVAEDVRPIWRRDVLGPAADVPDTTPVQLPDAFSKPFTPDVGCVPRPEPKGGGYEGWQRPQVVLSHELQDQQDQPCQVDTYGDRYGKIWLVRRRVYVRDRCGRIRRTGIEFATFEEGGIDHEIDGEIDTAVSYFFGTTGHLTRTTFEYRYDSRVTRHVREYSEKNHLTHVEEREGSMSAATLDEIHDIQFRYDERGNRLAEWNKPVSDSASGLVLQQRFDSKNRMIEKWFRSDFGDPKYSIKTYKYRQREGREIKITRDLDESGDVEFATKYLDIVGANGGIQKRIVFVKHADDEHWRDPGFVHEYEYDDRGRMRRVITHSLLPGIRGKYFASHPSSVFHYQCPWKE